MPLLLVNCHGCEREFSSEVSLTEGRVQGSLIDGVVYRCPYCGLREPYFTAEHHLPSSGGFAAARMARPPGSIVGSPRVLPSTPSRRRHRPERMQPGP